MGKPRIFAAMPLQAIADGRLSALDLRCIAVIAKHDGMSLLRGNGAGCYASHKTLAGLLGIDITSFSRTLSRLENLGYVIRERQEKDRRRQTIRVVYEQEDTCRDGQVSAAPSTPQIVDGGANYPGEMVDGYDNQTGEILDDGDSETRGNLPKTAAEYIPRSGEIDSVKQRKYSLERAQPLSAARREGDFIDEVFGDDEHPEQVSPIFRKNGTEAPAIQRGFWESLPPNIQSMSHPAKLSRFERILKERGYRVSEKEAAEISRVLHCYIAEFPGDPMEQQAWRMLEMLEAA